MTSTHCARPIDERCERPTSARESTCGDRPGRLAHGPDEKQGLTGRRLGCIALFPFAHLPAREAHCLRTPRRTYARARCRSISGKIAAEAQAQPIPGGKPPAL